MSLFEGLIFAWAAFLLVLGLVFEAAGFALFVAGRLDGLILLVVGLTMFWGGWVTSRAHGIWCASAAVLNMLDAASTLAFWSFEVNPLVVAAGPTIFMFAKIVASIAIVLYAREHPAPRKGGLLLTVFFALIVGWNLSQHLMAYLRFTRFTLGIVIGALLSLAVSAIVVYTLLLGEKHKEHV
ncbi:MAG: hypothetical protein NWE81_03040 [Candidatus Bathyarchaeota archaeon]|nr:hypothetical protein [Candidatus Bathyarchaeota archaeon]